MRTLRTPISALVALLVVAIPALAVHDIPNSLPKVSAEQWRPILDATWSGIKKRNIDAYSTGMIHRPKSETPGDAVSEGVGYGMLLALYSNDQATFNRIWEGGNKNLWGGCYYNWRRSPTGTIETGAATDAEEDVALSLIFAAKLVEAKKWNAYSDASGKNLGTYAEHAQKILNCMWSTSQIVGNGILAPGSGWGGYDFVNPGYFSPASYRIFKDFDSNTQHNWDAVINQSYTTLSGSPAYAQGMVPDWCTPAGAFTSPQGYNPYLGGRAFFKDAIRILWRVALDAIWFDEPRAKTFLAKSLEFLESKGGAPAANFYQLEGDSLGVLVPEADKWTDFNDKKNLDTWRYRREHSHLTIGMWATAAMAVGTDSQKKSFSKEMSLYYENDADADFFGKILDTNPAVLEDTLHNEMYFDQFLGWFGTAVMAGVFSNIVDDIDNPKTATTGIVYDPFAPIVPTLAQATASSVEARQQGRHFQAESPAAMVWSIHNLQGKLLYNTQGNTLAYTASQPGVYWIAGRIDGKVAYTRKVVLE